MSKTYTIVVEFYSEEETSSDVIDFICETFEDVEVGCEYEDEDHVRLTVEVPNDFDYSDLEENLDNNGYDCEFISVDNDEDDEDEDDE